MAHKTAEKLLCLFWLYRSLNFDFDANNLHRTEKNEAPFLSRLELRALPCFCADTYSYIMASKICNKLST